MKKEKREIELGNLMFGNSRGNYPLERDIGFENELYRLFDAYCPKRDNSWREYGEEFENEVFRVMPYYWGDCTCGFDNHEFTNEHINCYQNKLEEEKLKNGWSEKESGWLEYRGAGLKFGDDISKSWEIEQKKEKQIVKKLYEERGWNTKDKNWWYGCAARCDCDYNERYRKWLKDIGYPDGHKKECLLIQPNLLYKPTKFEIQWYKYPLRDSYTNQKITLEEFREIINSCIKSLIIKK